MANTLNLGDGNWATKEDSLLAYNSENNNYKPLPFSFSRESSATRVNKDGLIETVGGGQPRIDYKDNSKGALLLEPSRSNSITYSEDFSQSVWDTWQATKTQSNNINPKGKNGYYEISHTGSSTDNPNTRLIDVSLNGSYTLSTFIKINQSRYISLSIVDYDGDKARVYFDTINKTFTTISNVGSPITNTAYSEFSNDWIRISLSVNLLNAVYNEVGVGIYNPSGSFPSSSGEVISVFGAQLEQGSYTTSYIPTQGGTVTRLAESCVGAGNEQVFNDSEGTFFVNFAADFNIYNSGLTDRGISINDGTNTNSARIFQATSLNNRIAYDLDTSSGTNQVFNTSTAFADITDFNKVAFTYKENEFKIFLNGVQQGSTDTNGSVFSNGTLNGISFDYGQEGNKPFFGRVKEVKYFNTALTDQELQALTTI